MALARALCNAHPGLEAFQCGLLDSLKASDPMTAHSLQNLIKKIQLKDCSIKSSDDWSEFWEKLLTVSSAGDADNLAIVDKAPSTLGELPPGTPAAAAVPSKRTTTAKLLHMPMCGQIEAWKNSHPKLRINTVNSISVDKVQAAIQSLLMGLVDPANASWIKHATGPCGLHAHADWDSTTFSHDQETGCDILCAKISTEFQLHFAGCVSIADEPTGNFVFTIGQLCEGCPIFLSAGTRCSSSSEQDIRSLFSYI